MWNVETLKSINQEAAKLALIGKPERDAMENLGIRVSGNTSRKEKEVYGEAANMVRHWASFG